VIFGFVEVAPGELFLGQVMSQLSPPSPSLFLGSIVYANTGKQSISDLIERSDRWIIDHGALLGILLFSPLLPLAGVRWNESISDELFWFDLKTKGREKNC